MRNVLLKYHFLLHLICFVWNLEDHNNHETVARNNIFKKIFEHLNTTATDVEGNVLVTVKNLEKLFQNLHFRKCNSNEISKDCSLCVAVNDFLRWNSLSGRYNISQEEFEDLNTRLLYLLTLSTTSKVACKTFIQNTTEGDASKNFYNRIQKIYGNPINEESLEKILLDVDRTIGEKLTGEECFSAKDVIRSANVSETSIAEADFKHVAGVIIWKIATGKCIKKHQNTLPDPNFFIDEIFDEFSGANGGSMSREQFKEFYTSLVLRPQKDEKFRQQKGRTVQFKKCYTADDILGIYSVKEGERINQAKFKDICPSFVQQIQSGVCVKTKEKQPQIDKRWKAWIASTVAVFIVSIGSLSGVLTMPVSNKKWFPYLLITLVSMAVAVLAGDALIHLFPHALGLHGHDNVVQREEDGNPMLKTDSYMWKSLLLLFGVYLFFNFELIMHSFNGGHSHGELSSKARNDNNLLINKEQNCHELVKTSAHDSHAGISEMTPYEYYNISKKRLPIRDFESIVWMILIGDGIHNFLDGVAIGVAFSETWPDGYLGGISTSIAIFVHEVPHELGDFAVLLNSGLSIRQALCMNFISGLTAVIGSFVGVALGTEWEATPWIFSITAGVFVYIALVDMAPEVIQSKTLKDNKLLTIFLANFGLLIGFAMMFALGTWEDDIKTVLTQ